MLKKVKNIYKHQNTFTKSSKNVLCMSCLCFRGNFDDHKLLIAEKSEKYL